MSATTFTEQAARRWMVQSIQIEPGSFLDECGEARLTQLAEACAGAFDVNHEGGPLDDETHWIWDAAVWAADFTDTSH